MWTVLAILALSGILMSSDAIDCYQCMDVSTKYSSVDENISYEELDQFLEFLNQQAASTVPKCDSTHRDKCDEEMDSCGAAIVSYSGLMSGPNSEDIIMRATAVRRFCSMKQVVNEETVCDAAKEEMSGDDWTCQLLEPCTEDYCNTQQMEEFNDDADGDESDRDEDDHDGENYDDDKWPVSSDVGNCASLFLTVALSTAVMFEA